MFNGGNVPSLADIAAVTDNNRNNGFGDGMGGWWVLIILLALFGGWGNNGFGNGNRNNSCDNGGTTIVTVPTSGYGFNGGWGPFEAASMQRGFDNSGVIAKLDGLTNGVCNLGYSQLEQSNRLGNTVQQTGWNLNETMRDGQIAEMQQFNALTALINSCCCKVENGQMQMINAMDKNFCQSNWNLAQMGRDIMDNCNANYRSLEATVRQGFDNLREQGYQQEIAQLREEKMLANMRATAQWAVNEAVDDIRPCPKPSYNVPNPYCDCGSGCGYR